MSHFRVSSVKPNKILTVLTTFHLLSTYHGSLNMSINSSYLFQASYLGNNASIFTEEGEEWAGRTQSSWGLVISLCSSFVSSCWLFWVQPSTLRSSATARMDLRSSWVTVSSPRYMMPRIGMKSWYLTPRRSMRVLVEILPQDSLEEGSPNREDQLVCLHLLVLASNCHVK